MTTLIDALEREHREIDAAIEAYRSSSGGEASLAGAMTALRRHIWLEEEFLFPPLRAAGLMGPVLVMLREHGEIWDSMAGIDRLVASQADASEVEVACADLLARLDAHNAKEEPIVYPRRSRH